MHLISILLLSSSRAIKTSGIIDEIFNEHYNKYQHQELSQKQNSQNTYEFNISISTMKQSYETV